MRLLTDPSLSAGRDSTSYLQPAVQALDWEELMGEVVAKRVVGGWLVNPFADKCVAGNLSTVKGEFDEGWRICRDITSSGVNALISRDQCVQTRRGSIERTKLMLAAIERHVAAGGYIWQCKADVASAYKTIGLHPDDYFSRVIRVRDPDGVWRFFISRVCVFGCRSARSSFCRVSNALLWVCSQVG